MKIEDLLREAGARDREEGCRSAVEERLLAEFSCKAKRRTWPAWAMAAAAAIALFAILARVPEPLPQEAAPREVHTDFFALDPYAGEAAGDAYIVRVRVPRAAMANFGLPVRPELLDQRVEADLLVGGDGMTKAIRFVSQVQ